MGDNTSTNIEHKLRFLAESSKILASSLKYNTTLKSVAKLAVPEMADWCSVDILQANGEVKLLAVTHINPKKVKWAKELRKKILPICRRILDYQKS